MENEIMNFEETEIMEGEIVDEGGSGMGTGVAMLIGAGIACAIGAGVKLVKKGIAAYKAKKEAKASEHDFCVPADKESEAETK